MLDILPGVPSFQRRSSWQRNPVPEGAPRSGFPPRNGPISSIRSRRTCSTHAANSFTAPRSATARSSCRCRPTPSAALGCSSRPSTQRIDTQGLTAQQLQRLGAYEPVLQAGGPLIDRIEVPGNIIDILAVLLLLGAWQGGALQRQPRGVQRAGAHLRSRSHPIVDREPGGCGRLPPS